ncbi:hypothetical protein G3N56_19120 [Desulfovibrio sulfodismutans]|uniref:TIGR03067 domain-containing protein n=1 Tax=Desulfolutivibrio sulfodismutans TaxID=63561 RepID=A0A7K3NSN3_9BACT|nr:hypothetical protein [Desulfolutivibrio sulfodismutans]NDY58853.1 hypothetical protein [Desulfolutivibrio sulfodismutans]QLA12734.1 hypothetical protein GD606_10840 [Desulfolutivibrio sulfodismutans DSM 3696]
MAHFTRVFLALSWLALAIPAFAPAAPAAPGPARDIAGTWEAQVMGQSATVTFTQNGNLISGLLLVPDITGKQNSYHLSGTIVDNFFAAFHGSGHMLRGWLRGPDEADGELTLANTPPIALKLHRVR